MCLDIMTASRYPFSSGPMADKVGTFSWDQTPLGAIDMWSPALRITVDAMIASKFPQCLFWGPDLIAIYNDGYLPMLGNKEEALGQPLRKTWSEAWEQLRPICEKAMAGEAVYYEDFPLETTRRGVTETAYFTFCYSPIRDENGKVVGMIDTVMETTAAVIGRQRLVTERQRYEQMFANAPNFIAVLSGPDHIIEFANPAYLTLVGNRKVVGKPVRTALPEALEQGFVAILDNIRATGEPYTVTGARLSINSADGTSKEHFLDFVYQPMKDSEGKFNDIFLAGVDATERTVGQQALAALNADLEVRVEERTKALMQAEEALRHSQKLEAVGQLTGGIAHDFNNLLAGISGSVELAKMRLAQARTADVDRYLAGAQGAVERAAALTQRLLAFSRRQTLDPKTSDLNRIVADMEDLIARSVGPAVSMETAAAHDLWKTFVDVGQLENALLNLCLNARDAMPDGGKLTIETSNRALDNKTAKGLGLPTGEYVSLCVSDTGTGMSREVIARAFDPFYTTKPTGQGTGLGLSMVYGFAGQSDGTVSITSKVGQGSTICILLPRHFGDGDAEEHSTREAQLPRAAHDDTVLLVDDEPLVRMVAVEILEDLGYNVLEAEDGPTAMKILQSRKDINLLVSDVGLPNGMNGRQLADAARIIRPELKVLFVTGYAENAVLNHGHLERNMQVMTKPFSGETLARRVKELVSNS